MSHRRRKPKREIVAPDITAETVIADNVHHRVSSFKFPWQQQAAKPEPEPGQPPSGMNRQQRRALQRQVANQQRRGQRAFERAQAAAAKEQPGPSLEDQEGRDAFLARRDAAVGMTGHAHGEAR